LRQACTNHSGPDNYSGHILVSKLDPRRANVLGAIGHVALTVRDPARTAALFEKLFDVKVVQRIDAEGHRETFVRLGMTWFVLVQADVERSRTGDHIAFHVTQNTLDSIAEKLRATNAEFILARSNSSLYFFDYDNHVFELDTTDMDVELDTV
jgi:catechol 2,3-dioxygenase-like lactoylglutathione lyase family enzyme